MAAGEAPEAAVAGRGLRGCLIEGNRGMLDALSEERCEQPILARASPTVRWRSTSWDKRGGGKRGDPHHASDSDREGRGGS